MEESEVIAVKVAIETARKYGVQAGIDYIKEWSKENQDQEPDIKKVLLNFKEQYSKEDI